MFVSVPIRGLFNLTDMLEGNNLQALKGLVSVPIRGLFNLTGVMYLNFYKETG